MRGIEIARKLNISTSALRHYESWGLIPEVKREKNGYRIYTKEHEGYFKCIRAMYKGFGMDFVKQIMPLIIDKKVVEASWEINKAQVELYKEKKVTRQTIDLLDPKAISDMPNYKDRQSFSIGEVAKEAKVSTSAIRHWEKSGLINPVRNKDSRFREFSVYDIRKIFVIRTIQKAVFSLEIVHEVLTQFDNGSIDKAREIAENTLKHIDCILLKQIQGIASFNNLLEIIEEI